MAQTTMPAPRSADEVAASSPAVVSGARWLSWIALLTLVNAACLATRADLRFVIGLGFSELAHAVFQVNAAVAYVIDGFFVVLFLLLGQQARRGHAWAFVLGSGLYLCDALVTWRMSTLSQPAGWLPLAFHAFVLVQLVRGAAQLDAGLKAIKAVRAP
jgi:hypothetical protein